jgi:cysteine desulfurase
MMPYFADAFGNPSSFYARGRQARQAVDQARATIARILGAAAEEVFFTSCGTESDNWAITGAVRAQAGKGKHIITSSIEHHAVLHTCAALKRQGYDITELAVDHTGLVDPDAVRRAIRPDTVLVTIMLANNEIGTIQPIEAIAEICRAHRVLLHTDAVQAGGALPIDVRKLGVDLLSLSGHKFYAPKGVGVLYVRKGVRLVNFFEGGAQERGRRAGTENVAGIVGLARAFELADAELAESSHRLTALRDGFINAVRSRIPHTRLNGHPSLRLPNNINVSFEFIEGESILLMLDHYGYECSSGSACTSGSLDPSHVLLAIGLPHEIAHGSLRVTLGRSTQAEDLAELVDDLAVIVQRLRDMSPLYDAHLKQENTATPAG